MEGKRSCERPANEDIRNGTVSDQTYARQKPLHRMRDWRMNLCDAHHETGRSCRMRFACMVRQRDKVAKPIVTVSLQCFGKVPVIP